MNDSLAKSRAAAPSVPGRRPDAATHAARPVSRSATSLSIASRTSRSRVTGSSIARSPSAVSRSRAGPRACGGAARRRARHPRARARTTSATSITCQPPSTSPTRHSSPMRTSSRKVMLTRLPGSVRTSWRLIPGVSIGTRKKVRPACFAPVGARAGEEEDPVGLLGDAGEHLLAVDAPAVAVARPRVCAPRRRRSRSRVRCSPGTPSRRPTGGGAAPRRGSSRCPRARAPTTPSPRCSARRRARPNARARRRAPPALRDRDRRRPAPRGAPARSNRARRSRGAGASCGSCRSRGPARAPRR